MMFHPILMKYNGCEDNQPCQEPLKEELLIANDEVEAVHDNELNEDAMHQEYK